jgi:hypothetical protein
MCSKRASLEGEKEQFIVAADDYNGLICLDEHRQVLN